MAHYPIDEGLIARLPEPTQTVRDDPGNAQLQLSERGMVPAILGRCALLHASDKSAETWRKVTLMVAIAAFVGAFICVFVEAVAQAVVLGVILLIAAIARYTLGARDLEDRQLELVTGTLQTFAPELEPKRPVVVEADFTSHHKTPPAAEETLAGGLFVGTVKQYVWRHAWLQMVLPLADGSTAEIAVTTQVKRKTKRKRKYTKYKDALVDRLVIKLVPPKGKAFPGDLQTREPQLDGLSLKRHLVRPRGAQFVFQTRTARRMKGRSSWTSYGLTDLLTSRNVVAALIHSYKTVASARRET